MKTYAYNFLYAVALLFLQLSVVTPAQASHIVGSSLSYTSISNNVYRVQLVLYADCNAPDASIYGQLLVATPLIRVYNGSTALPDTLKLAYASTLSGLEIPRICPMDSTMCTLPSGFMPGIVKFTYLGTLTFPTTSANWRMVFNGMMGGGYGAGRSFSVTNLTSNTTTIQLEAKLNNLAGANSSPLLTREQPQFFCVKSNNYFDPVATDPDGDSLHFELVSAVDGSTGSPTGYVSGTSGTYPMTGSYSPYVNPVTGSLSFFSSFYENDLVVYKISEYRGGTLVGTSQKEMIATILDCKQSNCYTTLATENLSPLPKSLISIYPNPAYRTVTITLPARAESASISVQDMYGRAVASKTVQSTTQGEATISLPTSISPGTYFVTVTVGQQTFKEKLAIQ
jgi:hypothetical protein